MIKVVKFGGSSVANYKQFEKVKKIVESDPTRKFIVTSACGRDNHEDFKVTDLLYLCFEHIKYKVPCDNLFKLIEDKYKNIKNNLDLKFDIDKEFEEIKTQMEGEINLDYLVSRGEYLAAKMLAEYLDAEFVDAKDVIVFKYNGKLNLEKSTKLFEKYLHSDKKIVIPGFYGSINNTIKVMSRGGSDITGSIIANIVDASIYENWTDVSGILKADPGIVKNPQKIDYISYDELRELSYMGANVLHDEAIFPVKEKNITINIRNTNDMNDVGTMIVSDCSEYDKDHKPQFITGISGKKNFTIISCSKRSASGKVGTLRRALSILEDFNISVESVPAGIDTFSFIVESKKIEKHLFEILARLKDELECDSVDYIDHISLIVVVGRGMRYKPGISGKIFAELGDNGINIRVINQTADEIDIIIGVEDKDFEKTINCIYSKFIDGDLM